MQSCGSQLSQYPCLPLLHCLGAESRAAEGSRKYGARELRVGGGKHGAFCSLLHLLFFFLLPALVSLPHVLLCFLLPSLHFQGEPIQADHLGQMPAGKSLSRRLHRVARAPSQEMVNGGKQVISWLPVSGVCSKHWYLYGRGVWTITKDIQLQHVCLKLSSLS